MDSFLSCPGSLFLSLFSTCSYVRLPEGKPFLVCSADKDNAFTLLLFAWLRFSRFSALVSIACEDVFGSNKVGQKQKHWSHFRLWLQCSGGFACFSPPSSPQ